MERAHTIIGQHVILYSLVCFLVLSMGTALGGAGDTPRQGGTLRVATGGGGFPLDAHWTPSGDVLFITRHISKTCTPSAKTMA